MLRGFASKGATVVKKSQVGEAMNRWLEMGKGGNAGALEQALVLRG